MGTLSMTVVKMKGEWTTEERYRKAGQARRRRLTVKEAEAAEGSGRKLCVWSFRADAQLILPPKPSLALLS